MSKQLSKQNPGETSVEKEANHTLISADLGGNLELLHACFADCEDVIFAPFRMHNGISATLLYLRGSVDTDLLDRNVLVPLMTREIEPLESMEQAQELIYVSDRNELKTMGDIFQDVLGARPVLMIDTLPGALSIGLTKYDIRAVEEPLAESVVRGSREGFNESITVNTALVRKRLKTPALKFVYFSLGTYSKTEVAVAYIQGIAKADVIGMVSDRLRQVNIDGVLESGYLEELIQSHTYSPFPQLQTTERPDVAAASLLEGRIIILTDNTPMALIAPATFWSMMQSPEDYYQRYLIGTLIRWLRYAFFLIALLAPAVYVAVLTFHQEMVPTTLLLRVAKSREEIPFPALVEALIMEITFEALREAGIRLPRQVGSAVSIVGALVIGQAAIQAGLVSAPMVMVVAITGISSFMIPQYSASIALRILRFPIMILSGVLGLFGMIIALLLIISHLCILRSFGVPYMSPLAPLNLSGLKDVLIRAPISKFKGRPSFYSDGNRKRQGDKPET